MVAWAALKGEFQDVDCNAIDFSKKYHKQYLEMMTAKL